jgi:hypothetical protein
MLYARMYVRVCVFLYVCVHACARARVCVFVHVLIYVIIPAHIHANIPSNYDSNKRMHADIRACTRAFHKNMPMHVCDTGQMYVSLVENASKILSFYFFIPIKPFARTQKVEKEWFSIMIVRQGRKMRSFQHCESEVVLLSGLLEMPIEDAVQEKNQECAMDSMKLL